MKKEVDDVFFFFLVRRPRPDNWLKPCRFVHQETPLSGAQNPPPNWGWEMKKIPDVEFQLKNLSAIIFLKAAEGKKKKGDDDRYVL